MADALHRVRFSWDAKTHIEIEWSRGRGIELPVLPDAPLLSYAETELEPDAAAEAGVPAICWRTDAPVLFERFQLRENTEYLIDVTLPVPLEGLLSEAPFRRGWPFQERLGTVFRADPPRRWRSNSDGSTTISGQLRIQTHAGILDLSLSSNVSLVVEVVCRKFGYLSEFKALLDQVAEEFSELLLQYDSPVSSSFNLADVTPETEAALLFHLRNIMSERNLPVALDELGRSFHSRLDQWRSYVDTSSVQEPDIPAFIEEFEPSTMVAGGPLSKLFRGFSPREFPVLSSKETVDTAENRYVKFFLEELQLIAQRLAANLRATQRMASLHEVEGWIAALDEELQSGPWRQIGPFRNFPSNSQVLQKRRGYREILKLDLSLRMSLELPWKRAGDLADGLIGDLRPVSELYEYWCFFLLRRTLAELAESELPNDGSFIDRTENGFQLRLLKGKRSRIGFIYRAEKGRALKVNLFYNRTFPRPTHDAGWHGSYTARFDPDYSIEILLSGEGEIPKRHWMHFDAKYRLESIDFGVGDAYLRSDEAAETDYERELARVHRQDDLFKMHTYRDGILGSRGAYILFPGNGDAMRTTGRQKNMFIRHPSAFTGHTEYLFPSVGAFDLCPGRDDTQRPIVREFLRSVFDSLFDGRPYQEEVGFF
ncbi:hypothetical protein SAMN05880582_11571 [Rhizobium sp. RU20A]|uniref:DUF2357 domain-containing protein n=1 Tax=Rhizobium sp. RU20A TaxID=1907412 RepID=UPI0009547060|nr:DUF2357 domain-containing protein [Rhizobium sp. RU20A]SIR48582.1 hypothetical protein SAMN05880582_11571 [Rhizobium sp. RU20A]